LYLEETAGYSGNLTTESLFFVFSLKDVFISYSHIVNYDENEGNYRKRALYALYDLKMAKENTCAISVGPLC
jgi:hypothetical protein